PWNGTEAPPPFHVGWLASLLLSLGLLSSAYQLAMLRFYLYGSDRYGWTNLVIPESEFGGRFGAINLELRQAFATLDPIVPPSANVQYGPALNLSQQFLFYSRYQPLDGIFPKCGTDFGGSRAQCFELQGRLGPLFGWSATPQDADRIDWKPIYVPTLKS